MNILVVDNKTALLKDLKELTHTQNIVSYDQVTTEIADEADLVVLSGSSGFPILGNEGKLEKEITLIKETKTPIIGICYGAELVAYTFGGHLREMPEHDTGIVSITPIVSDPIFELMDGFSAYEYHGYRITDLPPEFEIMAVSDHAIEVFRHRNRPMWGLQFHPEEGLEGRNVFLRIVSSCHRYVR